MNQRQSCLRLLVPLAWAGLLIPWTWALLTPVPKQAVTALGGPEASFWFGKTLHVSVYATLALLTCQLPWPRRIRLLLLALLIAHGASTEYLQQFVGRGSSWRDWGLDSSGVALGTGLGWALSRWRRQPRRACPQVQLQGDARGKNGDAADLR